MAEIDAIQSSPDKGSNGIAVYTWSNVGNTDTFEFILLNSTRQAMTALQMIGTVGGATLTMEGSNNGTDWVTIPDLFGSTAGLNAVGGAEYSTSYVYLRPAATGGGGTQDITVILCARE